ncbi:MAG TPA: hypothetical protein DCM86_00780, partial [Verrucomicrobiales bacterium]|nr:hypothetical protein [Verrucomicrobiales bacterium]
MKNLYSSCLPLVLAAVAFGTSPAHAANVDDGLIISEFMANNVNTIRDDFGQASDYVEIYNGTGATIDLSNYYLTDTAASPLQWQFPSTNLVSGRHLLVWASGRNIALPGKPLHTNFKLSATGEQIILSRADGSTVHGYTFGVQAIDRSYGMASEVVSTTSLLTNGVPLRYLSPTNNVSAITNADPAKRWISPVFDDSSWSNGVSGIGFDTNPVSVLRPFIATDVQSLMFNTKPPHYGLYTRIPFVVDGTTAPPNPMLQIRYDDGFVAFLNGVEIGRRRFTNAVPDFKATAPTVRSNEVVIVPEEVATYGAADALKPGTNILAIQVVNKSNTDSDLLLAPELVSREIRYLTGPENERYFANPTPGAANAVGVAGVAGEITFSQSSTTFSTDFDLILTAADATPLTQIRYTVDGSNAPTATSFLYTGPIHITNSLPIRARAFEPGFLPGPVHSEAFVKLGAGADQISSDVAMILVHSFGNNTLDENTPHPSFLFVFEPVNGRSSFTNPPTKVFRAGMKIRGSSTAGNPKSNWAVDPWDEDDLSYDTGLLGMPAGAPWVFHAPLGFDPSRFHNPLASDLSNEVGSYASRYRFAEVYLNTTSVKDPTKAAPGATLTYNANYFGFYNILEHINVSPNRVAVDKLAPGDIQEPEVTGGYLFSIDRALGSDPQYTFGRQNPVNLLSPDARHIVPEQMNYLTTYFNAYANELFANDWTNRDYLAYMDLQSWIDHHIINVIACNVDGMRLSGYFHKPRSGPITYGPVWDFDRAFGSTDGRDAVPRRWRGDGDSTYFFTVGSSYPLTWWERLFKDINFFQAWVDRFQDLREGIYSDSNILALMDQINSHVVESAPRDAAKWGNNKRLADGTQSGAATQATEVSYFKHWMRDRLNFMDTNFLAKPTLGLAPGQVASGALITLSAPAGSTIYYTLDGTDPRAKHGLIAANALVYTAPIPVTSEVRLVARSRDLAHKNLNGGPDNPPVTTPWSGTTRARYVLDPLAATGDLIVTEINYNPAPPTATELAANPALTSSDFEYLEIKNASSHRVDFLGARFTKGISFTFTETGPYTLAPNGILLLVSNPDAFALRYGAKPNIAGAYSGALNDAGDTLQLEDAAGRILIHLTYNDSWYPTTDGFGYTLVRQNNTAGDGSSEAWGPSSQPGGSPGVENPAPAGLPVVVINEILANTTGKAVDAIELLNRSRVPADVSGWYLTDDRTVPKKYRIPAGTPPIAAGGFLVIPSTLFNAGPSTDPSSFGLSSMGDEAWIFSADVAGNLLSYSHGFAFGPSDLGVSFGRYLISTGKELLVPQRTATLGAANSGPAIGPVVITDIMYHPPEFFLNNDYWNNDYDSYVVLKNISAASQTFYDSTLGAEWHLRGVVDFNFPSTFTLVPDASVVLVGWDPVAEPGRLAAFRQKFDILPAVQVLGPWSGQLNNKAGSVRLSRPGPTDATVTPPDIGYVVIDQVDYEDQAPWPVGADGAGAAIKKKDALLFGNDPANWVAALPSPGKLPTVGALPVVTTQPVGGTVVAGVTRTFTVTAQSTSPVSYQWQHNGVNIHGATSATLTLNPVRMTDAGSFSALVINASGVASSSAATLVVLQPAVITQGPEGSNIKPGANYTMSVKAIGTGPLSYQWTFEGKTIAGATQPSFTISNAQLKDSGDYVVRVTDSIGTAVSDPATVNVLVKPVILTQPTPQIALVGDTVEFQVEATGLQPLSYTWRRGNTTAAVPGNPTAGNRVLRITNVALTNATNYSVSIGNLATGSNPTLSLKVPLVVMEDKDGDRMGDAWELDHGLNPADPSDASRDDDGDGQTNLQEFLAGTDPHDKTSFLRISSIASTTNGMEVGFLANSNRAYSLQFKEHAAAQTWLAAGAPVGVTNDRPTVAIDRLPPSTTRVYRLATPPALGGADVPPPV